MDTHRSPVRAARSRWRLAVPALLAAAVLALSACSAGGQEDAPATGGAGDAAGLAWASETVAFYDQQPTEIPAPEPVGAPIPEGKNVMFISCGAVTCVAQGERIKAATDLLGWNLTVVNTDGSEGQLKSAFQQAVQTQPDGLIFGAADKAVFADELAQLEAAGVKTATCCQTYEATDGISGVISGGTGPDSAFAAFGDISAASIIDDSQGDANALFVNLPSFPILNVMSDQFTAAMGEHCPGCEVETMDISLSQLGNKDQQIVAFLQSHPDYKYVGVAADDLVIGLPAALAAAGLDDVKIVGTSLNPTTSQYLRNGQMHSDMIFPLWEVDWTMVDVLAREFAGVPVPEYRTAQPQRVVQATVPESDEFAPITVDFLEQFKANWGLTG